MLQILFNGQRDTTHKNSMLKKWFTVSPSKYLFYLFVCSCASRLNAQ